MPDNHENGKFEGRTYLLIRDHLQDDGTEPLAAALPAWLSPDIVVVKPDGTAGSEAEVGVVNHVEVTVRNLGGIPAVGTYVDAFFASTATGFTPATAAPIGGAYVDVAAYGAITVSLPWVPPASYAGHGCILARASLIIPPDTYVDPTVFDPRGDRHVAQRNIEVIQLAATDESAQFTFNLVNPLPRPIRARVLVQEVREADAQRAVGAAMGCGMVPFAPEPLRNFGLLEGDRHAAPGSELMFGVDVTAGRVPTAHSITIGSLDRELVCALEPGEVCQAMLYVERNAATRQGDVHALEIRQLDERGTLMGGLTVLVRH